MSEILYYRIKPTYVEEVKARAEELVPGKSLEEAAVELVLSKSEFRHFMAGGPVSRGAARIILTRLGYSRTKIRTRIEVAEK